LGAAFDQRLYQIFENTGPDRLDLYGQVNYLLGIEQGRREIKNNSGKSTLDRTEVVFRYAKLLKQGKSDSQAVDAIAVAKGVSAKTVDRTLGIQRANPEKYVAVSLSRGLLTLKTRAETLSRRVKRVLGPILCGSARTVNMAPTAAPRRSGMATVLAPLCR
jgi:hypothetical protein